MKHYIKVFVAIVIGISITSCDLIEENLNQKPEELILGNWYSTGYTIDGEFFEWPDEDLRMYDYQDDGEISVFKYQDGELEFMRTITYVLNDGTIEITEQNEPGVYTITNLDIEDFSYEHQYDTDDDGTVETVGYHHERRY